MTIDRKVYPFMACCTLCGEQIADKDEAVQVTSGVINDASFEKEDYPVLYHAACFDKMVR